MICHSPGKQLYNDLHDPYYGHTSGWSFYKCTNRNCGLLWLNPMPVKEDIGKAYLSYYTHESQRKNFLSFSFLVQPYLALRYGYYPLMPLWKKITGFLVWLLPPVKNRSDFSVFYLPFVNNGRVLDFGCGNGWLLDNLRQAGWDCYGLDFDPKAVEFCRSKGLKVNTGDIDSQNYPDEYFDAITINHVIEHVHEVDELIENCFRKLKKGGKLIIATPNTENWQHRLYGKEWFQLDPPRHLHLFALRNLEMLVARHKFSVLKSFSTIRMDSWSTIVTRGVRRNDRFEIGKSRKNFTDIIVGLFHQCLSFVYSIFNKKSGGEIILIAEKK